MAAVAGLLPKEVTHVVSSAVSLHLRITPRSRRSSCSCSRRRRDTPYGETRSGASALRRCPRARWPPSRGWPSDRDCDNPVCAMASYMYGTGPDVLLAPRERRPRRARVARAGARLHAVPADRPARQERRRAAHLVPAEAAAAPGRRQLRRQRAEDEGAPSRSLSATKNRMFLPGGPAAHVRALRLPRARSPPRFTLDGFGHLDTIVGGAAAGKPLGACSKASSCSRSSALNDVRPGVTPWGYGRPTTTPQLSLR